APYRASIAAQHEVVIITTGHLQLFVVVVDARADGCRTVEIHWRVHNRTDFTGWNQSLLHGRETVSLDRQFMVEDGSLAGEIEIRVISQINNRVPIGRRK